MTMTTKAFWGSIILAAASYTAAAQTTDWRYYAGDAHNTKYSALDQINESNVKRLQVAWRWKSEIGRAHV